MYDNIKTNDFFRSKNNFGRNAVIEDALGVAIRILLRCVGDALGTLVTIWEYIGDVLGML